MEISLLLWAFALCIVRFFIEKFKCDGRKQERRSFFEKKNQKTSINLGQGMFFSYGLK
jgi:hypothetical protein